MLGHFNWVFLAIIVFVFPWILRVIIPKKVTVVEAMVASVLSIVCAFIFFHAGRFEKSLDYEVFSGEIVNKKRIHDSYQQSYDCNCKENKCDTCYRTIYTVEWKAYSNIGSFRIASDESRSRSVYNQRDPERYRIIQNGDPVSTQVSFTNYVKGVPDSLFNEKKYKGEYTNLVPKYPSVYDFYNINRVFFIGDNKFVNLNYWNGVLSNYQKNWGYQNKANIIIVLTDKQIGISEDIRTQWLLGKQNDMIVVIGLKKNEIDWVSVLGWSENENIKVSTKSDLMDLKNIDNPESIFQVIDSNIKKGYKYRDMKQDFSHLKELVEPPDWIVVMAYVICFGISIAMAFVSIDDRLKSGFK